MVKTKHIRTAIAMRAMRRKLAHPLKTKSLINFKFIRTPLTKLKGVIFKLKNSRLITRSTMKQRLSAATLFATAIMLVISLILPGMNARAAQTLTWSSNADFAFNKASKCQAVSAENIAISGTGYTDSTCAATATDAGLILGSSNSDLSNVKMISAGSSFSVALKNDGTVWSWGNNGYGQLGDGTYIDKPLPTQVKDFTGTGYLTDVKSISANYAHVLALKNDGTVWAWGYNNSGRLGDGSSNNANLPVKVLDVSGSNQMTGVTAVAAGGNHSMALKSDGTVYAWGNGQYGQPGDNGGGATRFRAVQVKDAAGTGYLSGVSKIAAGYYDSFAIKADGTLWGWGMNTNSQLGDNTTTNRFLPVQVRNTDGTGYIGGVTEVAAGAYHTMAITTGNILWSWGSGGNGQLGDGASGTQARPIRVKDTAGTGYLTDVAKIATGSSHSVAVKTDGTVWAWGYNYSGQIGDGSTTTRSLPVLSKNSDNTNISGVADLAQAGGSEFSLALKANGTVLGWGKNDLGQLGHRMYGMASVPKAVSVVSSIDTSPMNDIKNISTAEYNSLAVKNDGTVWAWGNNSSGQLGDGTTTSRTSPVKVKDSSGDGYLSDVKMVAAVDGFSLALKNDGTVWAWGDNGYGKLGDGTNTARTLPVQVKDSSGSSFLSDITWIAAANNSSYAVKSDGTLWAWGYNSYYQLGDGTNGQRWLPVQVKDPSGTGYLSNVTKVAGGSSHAIALKSDGTVWAWGYNAGGQIGDGTTTTRSLPVQVKLSSGFIGNITAITAGNAHNLALKNDGTVWAWGDNAYKQLGTSAASSVAIQTKDSTGSSFMTGITKIAASSSTSYALKSDGTVWAFGLNNYGQLGSGGTSSATWPVLVRNQDNSAILSGITDIYAGNYAGLAQTAQGNILYWGRNLSSWSGIGNYIERVILPVIVYEKINYLTGYQTTGNISGFVFDIGQGKKTKWYGINWNTDSLPAGTSVKFNVRTSNDAETWSEWTQDFAQNSAGSTAGDGDISTLPLSRYIELKATLATTDNSVTPKLNDFSLSYLEDTTAPDTNAANIVLKRSSSGSVISDGGWINNQTPYFSWDTGVDVDGGAGIQGYCLYLGQDTTADFEQTDGILGDSPLDTGGACQYATENNYLDLSQSGALASEFQTGNNPYYLLVKAIDYGANIYEGEAASFSFNYDATPPTNPMFISAPSQFVSTKDVTLTWPNSGLQGPLDSDSQIAGLQYRIGSSGTWYGESHNGNEDLTDLLANDGNYQTVEEFDYDLLNEGNNIVYFRTLDRAGNVSTSYITAVIKINTSSPSQPLNVTATPSTNTSNSFAFSWHQPATFVGPASGITYCYTVNALPNSNNCSWTKPGQASLSADAYATQPDENIFYVVAKDEAGNINYATYGSVSFTAKTEAPGLPRNFEIADVSTKASETWKIALSWTTPADAGAGVAKYVIYRSTDGTAYSQIATTTGQSYVDGPLAQREYFYQIRACDSANKCGADTEPLSMTPTGRYTTPPELISSVNSEVSTRRASFSWATDRNSDSRIQYGTESGVYMAGEVTVSEPTKSHAVELLGLDAGTTYYYKVKWTDEDGNTGISSELTFTTKPAPVVKDVQVIKKTLNSALIQFTSTDAAKVSIQYGQSENFGGIKTVNTSLTESTYIVELVGLNDGTTYFYKLNTFDSEGNQYDSRRIDTFATPQRPRIANLRFQPVQGEPTSTQKVTWTTNVPTTSTITYGKNGSNGSDIYSSVLTTDHVVTVRGLEDDSQYFLLAQSRDADGNLAVSDRQLFRTALDTRPPKISDVLIETSVKGNGSEARGQIVVSWKTDEPATSQVAYADGSGGNYTSRTAEDMRLTTEHVVIISDLSVSKVYHLQPISSDRADNETGGEDQSAIIGRASDSVLNIILNSLYRIFGL